MKKMFYGLICLAGLSACKSENFVLDALRVYDVANSACKLTLSEARSDSKLQNDAVSSTLYMELGKDGIAQCMMENVEANCGVSNIYVSMTNQDTKITLVVYHNELEAFADCVCKYDVNFKMSKLVAGSYDLEVYYASPKMKYDESGIAYRGKVSLVSGERVRVSLDPEKSLPET